MEAVLRALLGEPPVVVAVNDACIDAFGQMGHLLDRPHRGFDAYPIALFDTVFVRGFGVDLHHGKRSDGAHVRRLPVLAMEVLVVRPPVSIT